MLAACVGLLAVHPLATVNALLNALATVLLVVGYALIKQQRELAHKRVMLSAFGVSAAFLVCYLAYHVWPVGAKATPFPGPASAKIVYLTILLTHIILAASVPVLAMRTIWLGLQVDRVRHRRWAKWTFPIWLYVSVTGVVIYLMLYRVYPAAEDREPAPSPAAVLYRPAAMADILKGPTQSRAPCNRSRVTTQIVTRSVSKGVAEGLPVQRCVG